MAIDRQAVPHAEKAASPDGWFLECFPIGDITITFLSDTGHIDSIKHLSLEIIEERCPLLRHVVELFRSGPRLHLDMVTSETVWPFLRYIYTGSYIEATTDSTDSDQNPANLLLHIQMYELGHVYDVQGLKSQAYLEVVRQCDLACSYPAAPVDLCIATRYIYERLSTHKDVIDAIVDYCVECFWPHRLGDNNDFRRLLHELRPFYYHICKNVTSHVLSNESATAIIRRISQPYTSQSRIALNATATESTEDGVVCSQATVGIDTPPKRSLRADDETPPSVRQHERKLLGRSCPFITSTRQNVPLASTAAAYVASYKRHITQHPRNHQALECHAPVTPKQVTPPAPSVEAQTVVPDVWTEEDFYLALPTGFSRASTSSCSSPAPVFCPQVQGPEFYSPNPAVDVDDGDDDDTNAGVVITQESTLFLTLVYSSSDDGVDATR